jgi:hypothetical protein
MAEETKTTATATETNGATETTGNAAELETMRAELAKMKASFDRASSELAEHKRRERDRMTEDEKRAAAEAEREAHYKELERRIALSDYSAELDDVTDGKIKNDIAELLAEGKIVEALKKFKEFRVKDRAEMEKRIKAELMKQNPQASAQTANPTAKTKDEIMAIVDAEERQRAIAENIHLFVK